VLTTVQQVFPNVEFDLDCDFDRKLKMYRTNPMSRPARHSINGISMATLFLFDFALIAKNILPIVRMAKMQC
jgi:hypothetical protein